MYIYVYIYMYRTIHIYVYENRYVLYVHEIRYVHIHIYIYNIYIHIYVKKERQKERERERENSRTIMELAERILLPPQYAPDALLLIVCPVVVIPSLCIEAWILELRVAHLSRVLVLGKVSVARTSAKDRNNTKHTARVKQQSLPPAYRVF